MWYLISVPACRGGCRGYSRGIVGRVRNIRQVLAGPPKRSTGPRLQSGYNQLQKQLGRNTDRRVIYIFIYCISVNAFHRVRIQMVSGMLVSRESMMFCISSCRPGVWNKSSCETFRSVKDRTFIIFLPGQLLPNLT